MLVLLVTGHHQDQHVCFVAGVFSSRVAETQFRRAHHLKDEVYEFVAFTTKADELSAVT